MKFNRGHLTPGTVAIFESPLFGRLEESREDQEYNTREVVIADIGNNGPNSWFAEFEGEEFNGANVSWCRGIIKRGPDVPFRCKSYSKDAMAYVFTGLPKPKNSYRITNLIPFIQYMIEQHYATTLDHMYSINGINTELMQHPTMLASMRQTMPWRKEYIIGKKKFHKLFKAVMSHHRLNRRHEQKLYDEEMAQDYFQMMEKEYAEDLADIEEEDQ